MKRWLMIFTVIGLLSVSTVFGAISFTCTVQNQYASGTDYIFDIYMVRTGSDNIYMGDCDFAFNYNSGNFTSPAFSVVSKGNTNYGMSGAVPADGRVVLNVRIPIIDVQDDFDTKVQVISNSGFGTRIATVKITNIANPSGTAGLQWRLSGGNQTIVNTLATSAPWAGTNITGNGTYTNPGDISLPVQMTGLTVEASREQGVVVAWRVESEVDCAGFQIWRRDSKEGEYSKITNSLIPGQGNSSAAYEYTYTDRYVKKGILYWYKVEEVSTIGESRFFGPISTEGISLIPTEFGLSQNYPNPFNPETTIECQLAEACIVRVVVYNMMGQEVRRLLDGRKSAGFYEVVWDGKNEQGIRLGSGAYLVRMEAGSFSSMRKVVIVK